MSSPRPWRGQGWALSSRSPASPAAPKLMSGVLIAPGQMALTRMSFGASSIEVARVRPMTACLAAVYACGPLPPLMPATDDVLMIDPPVPSRRIARAACFDALSVVGGQVDAG